jgi:hypothetical protein
MKLEIKRLTATTKESWDASGREWESFTAELWNTDKDELIGYVINHGGIESQCEYRIINRLTKLALMQWSNIKRPSDRGNTWDFIDRQILPLVQSAIDEPTYFDKLVRYR